MAIIAFFCLPAYGHTNPTLEVVRELTKRNHQVVYFSFSPFQQRIEEAGARFINCDAELSMDKAGAMAANSEVGGSIKLLTDTTLALDKKICETLQALQPDCIVADSMAVWGKFAALKLGIPLISSTTTFAFNRYSAKIMKQSFGQLFSLIRSMPQIRRQIRRLLRLRICFPSCRTMIRPARSFTRRVNFSRVPRPFPTGFSLSDLP